MTRFLPIAAVALLAGSAARAQTYDISNLTPRGATVEVPRMDAAPAVDAAPEFHPAGAIAALTLLLCGVAVLKGWRRE
jgi:hypothetical protein